MKFLGTQDYDSIKKKYSNKLKSVNDDNLMLKAEKEKLKSELELTSKTKGVSREEYEKVKRKAEIMRKRMANFALVRISFDWFLIKTFYGVNLLYFCVFQEIFIT